MVARGGGGVGEMGERGQMLKKKERSKYAWQILRILFILLKMKTIQELL